MHAEGAMLLGYPGAHSHPCSQPMDTYPELAYTLRGVTLGHLRLYCGSLPGCWSSLGAAGGVSGGLLPWGAAPPRSARQILDDSLLGDRCCLLPVGS